MITTDLFESQQQCPECGGPAFSDLVLAEKKDACYSKVRSRYKVWPSAYASGALVQCRKKGAANWGNKSESVAEGSDMCHVCGQTPCNCTYITESVGGNIKALYQKIANQGDDAIEFMYYDSPIFAQYWDEYEGDLDSIIAEVDPQELQIILDELQSAAEDQGIAENHDNGEYSDEAGMAHGNLITIAKAARGLLDTIDQHEDLPEWVQEKIAKVEGMLVSAWNYLQSQEAQGIDPRITEVYGTLAEAWSHVRHRMELVEEFDIIERVVEGLAVHNGVDQEVIWEDLESLTDDELYVFAVTTPIMEDWQKVNKRDKTDGMSRKAVKAYRREHPGSKLKTAVTTKPSKLKKGSKASKRRKSYCSRSRGQMKMHHISCAKTPDKAICKARRRWNCESMEHSGTMVAEVDMTRRGFLRGLGAAIGAAAAGNALAGANDPGFIRKVQDAHYDMVDKNPRYAKEHAALQLPFARGISGNAAEMNKRWAEKTAELLQKYGVAINEAAGPADQLSVQQLATISDEALDRAYHYGRSTPGNTFGWQANLKSAAFAKRMIDAGVTDIEAIADAIHKGWNTTAQAFVSNPEQFDDTEKLRQAGKLEAKLQQRAQLMKQNYAQLPEEEKEKDRVVARALLQAIRGNQSVAEAKMSPQQQHDFDRMRAGAMSRKEYDAKWKKPRKSDDEVIYGKRKSVAEMDKSQPSHGRDGHVSHSTYGSRDKGGSQGQDRTARMTTADRMMRDAEKKFLKHMSNADKVEKGWRNPNIDEGSETATDIDKKIEFHKQGQAAAQYKGSMNKMHAAKIRELEAKKKQQGVAEVSDDTLTSYLTKVHTDSQKHDRDPSKRSPEKRNRSVAGFARAFNKLDARKGKTNEALPKAVPSSQRDPGALATRAHIASQEKAHSDWAAKQKALADEFYKNHPELDDRPKPVTQENSMADELARMAMRRNPNALVRVDGKTLQSPPPGPKPAGTTTPRPVPAFDPEAEYSDDYSVWYRRTHGVKEGTSVAEAWARRYPNINADIAECKSLGDNERLKRLISIKSIIDSDLSEQSGLGFGQ